MIELIGLDELKSKHISLIFSKHGLKTEAYKRACPTGQTEIIIASALAHGFSPFEFRQTREQHLQNVPVVMCFPYDDEVERIVYLEMGADDCIHEDIDPLVLVARVKSILRRYRKSPLDRTQSENSPYLVLDDRNYELWISGRQVPLTLTEYRLLRYLMNHAGTIVSRDAILRNVFDGKTPHPSRTIDTHISSLRAKIEPSESTTPKLIQTIRGIGYRFEEPVNLEP